MGLISVLKGMLLILLDTLFMRWNAWTKLPKSPLHPSIANKTVIVTGPTSGIGLATARALAAGGAKVILACRNVEAGEKLASEWCKSLGVPSSRLLVMELDVSSFRSVKLFANEVLKNHVAIHCLINNAGIFDMGGRKREVSADGHEAHLQINYLSHFLLTALLMPALKKAGNDARIVNVSSILHMNGTIDLDNMDFAKERTYVSGAAYSRSKLAQIMCSTVEMQRRLPHGCGVSVFAVHPGTVKTGVVRTLPKIIQIAYNKIVAPLFFLNPEEGAASSLFAASQPNLASKGGSYIAYCKVVRASKLAYDHILAAKLWSWTCNTLSIDENWAKSS